MEKVLKAIIVCLVLSCCFSCSEKVDQKNLTFQIEISRKKSLDLSNSQLSSELPWMVSSLKHHKEAFLVYNQFERSIDTVYLDREKKAIAKGRNIPKEGPLGIENFFGFLPYRDYYSFVDNKMIYFPGKTSLIRMDFSKSELSFELGLTHIAMPASPTLDIFNSDTTELYFFGDNFTNEITSLIQYKIENDSFSILPFSPIEKMAQHQINFTSNSISRSFSVSNTATPRLLVTDKGCLVYFNFTADFQFFDFESGQTIEINPKSELFRLDKKLPVDKEGIEDLESFISYTKEWNHDVEFGPFYPIYEGDYFYRMVRGELKEKRSRKYLEIFDSSFEKIQEVDLNEIESDLYFYYFPVGEQLLVKAADQSSEDQFDYYLLRFSKE